MAIDFPNSPTIGDTYTTNGKTYRWDGTVWGIYGTFSRDFTASDTEPTGVSDGHIWYRSDQSQTLIRYDGTWVEVGSAGGFDSSSTSFPSSLDSGTGFAAVEALQAKVGVDGSAVTTSIDYRLNTLSYQYVQTVYFTSSGTFTKATYPWLRAIRVKVQGAGGGSGGCETTGAGEACGGGGGGGGGYAEKFITDIAGLSASETVTVGSGGAGGAAGNNAGSTGGTSSAFSVSATGGGGGLGGTAAAFAVIAVGPGFRGGGSGGDLNIQGSDAGPGWATAANRVFCSSSGGSMLGGSRNRGVNGGTGSPGGGVLYGGGAQGPSLIENRTQTSGAAGADGIVIVELFA